MDDLSDSFANENMGLLKGLRDEEHALLALYRRINDPELRRAIVTLIKTVALDEILDER